MPPHSRLLTAALLAAAFLVSLDARLAPAQADDVADCQSGQPDKTIRGCTAIIKSGRLFGNPISKENLALVYFNRGLAHTQEGDLDDAIADFGQAVRISPNHANAYASRGEVSTAGRSGGFPSVVKWGYPKKWMVCKGKSPSIMDDDCGYPYFRKLPYCA